MKCHSCTPPFRPVVGLIVLALAIPYFISRTEVTSSWASKSTDVAYEHATTVASIGSDDSASGNDGSTDFQPDRAEPSNSDRASNEPSGEVEGEGHAQEPLSKPAELPEWVIAPPSGERDGHRSLVHSDYHATERDCRRALNDEIRRAAAEYIADYLGNPQAPLLLNYSLEEIKARFLQPEYRHHEVREFSFGMMHQTHALLDFPPEFGAELDQRWSHVIQAGRIVAAAGATVGILMLLTLSLGFLRWNQWMSGFGGAPLQWLAGAAILAFVMIGIWAARTPTSWLQWLLSQTYW
jgi:hypothetical protein